MEEVAVRRIVAVVVDRIAEQALVVEAVVNKEPVVVVALVLQIIVIAVRIVMALLVAAVETYFVNRKLPERMVRLGVQHRLFLAEVPAI